MDKRELSHLDEYGKIRMVDVGDKKETERQAVARGQIRLQPETLDLIQQELIKKGDVLTVARLAGIMGAKNTSNLIPLCHPVALSYVDVRLDISNDLPGILITAEVHCSGKTGVEMEALTAVSIAGLTVYDMIKAVEKTGIIENIHLVEKHGGKSGSFYQKQGKS